MSPIPILVALLIAAAAAGGWFVRGWRENSVRLVEQRQVAHEEFRRREKLDGAAAAHEGERAGLQAEDRDLTKEIDRVAQTPAGRGQCLDADGLRILRAAISGPRDPGEPAAAVRAADGAGERDERGGAALGQGHGALVPRVRGPGREAQREVTP